MAARPHIQLQVPEIEALAKDADAELLRALVFELSHRNRSKPQKLKTLLEKRLAGESPAEIREASQQPTVPVAPNDSKTSPSTSMAATDLMITHSPAAVPESETQKATEGLRKKPQLTEFQGKAWVPSNKDKESSEESANPLDNIIKALQIEIDAVKKQAADLEIKLFNGNKVETGGDHTVYQFSAPDDIRLNDDQPVEVIIDGESGNGYVAGIDEHQILIALYKDMGPFVKLAHIRPNQAGLLEKLHEKFKGIRDVTDSPFRLDFAKKVLGEGTVEKHPCAIPSPVDIRQNTEEQKNAIQIGLDYEVCWIWGPPGCGKSFTLTPLIESFFHLNKRILITANTNKAVDGLLEKLCKQLQTTSNQAIRDRFVNGAVLRFGNLEPELEPYRSYIDLDAIVERLSVDLTEKRRALLEKMDSLTQAMAPHKQTLKAFHLLRRKDDEIQSIQTKVRNDDEDLRQSLARLDSLPSLLAAVHQALASKRQQGGFARGISEFLGGKTEASLNQELAVLTQEQETLPVQIESRKRTSQESAHQLKQLQSEQNELLDQIRGEDEELHKRALEPLEKQHQEFSVELADILRGMEDVGKEVIRNSQVIACTTSKLFIDPDVVGEYDVAIIDEGSMLPIAQLVYVAGHAKSQVVIAGDFRQLPPICLSNDGLVEKWYGLDPFERSGIAAAVDAQVPPAHLAMLTANYRSSAAIVGSFNSLFYGGKLHAANPDLQNGAPCLPPGSLIPQALTFYDTSAYSPFVSQPAIGRGRFNLLHAFAVRALCDGLVKGGMSPSDIGVIAPYKLQADMIGQLLAEAGMGDIVAGTVHRFQGSERVLMVYDTTESPWTGCYPFATAKNLTDDGAKLLNVALSRPKHYMVMIGNLQYLYKELSDDMLLAKCIRHIQAEGAVLDADALLRGIGADAQFAQWHGRQIQDVPNGDSLVLDENTAMGVLLSDIAQAQNHIVIYSGFATRGGVGRLVEPLRAKLKTGVAVRIVCRSPGNMGSISEEEGKEALEALMKIGCAVDLRTKMHVKVVIIDGQILYNGSLNFLSTNFGSEELMIRSVSPAGCEVLAKHDRWRKGKRDSEGASLMRQFAEEENPRCPECEGLMVYITPRKKAMRPFLKCIDAECAASMDPSKIGKKTPVWLDMSKRMPCPKCEGTMKPKGTAKGTFFWSCEHYPECSGSKSLRKTDFETK